MTTPDKLDERIKQIARIIARHCDIPDWAIKTEPTRAAREIAALLPLAPAEDATPSGAGPTADLSHPYHLQYQGPAEDAVEAAAPLLLPDCMMPDGGECCVGYHQLWEALTAARAAILDCHEYRSHNHFDALQRVDAALASASVRQPSEQDSPDRFAPSAETMPESALARMAAGIEPELDRLIDALLYEPAGEAEEVLAKYLLDNKVGILRCLQALARQPSVADQREAAIRWQHKTTGHIVEEIGRGKTQDSTSVLGEMTPVVIYRHDGKLWVRAVSEFEDGRFALLPSANSGEGA